MVIRLSAQGNGVTMQHKDANIIRQNKHFLYQSEKKTS